MVALCEVGECLNVAHRGIIRLVMYLVTVSGIPILLLARSSLDLIMSVGVVASLLERDGVSIRLHLAILLHASRSEYP